MKKHHDLKHKIIFYVMSAAILVTVLVTSIMFMGSVRSTDATLLGNMQITARIAAQNISSNLHLLTERKSIPKRSCILRRKAETY